ncbi:hypothetical protein C8J56DRAFT_1042777 [Mycena floridula]|nr:hypothetical protein C8J56DRAFT_1042777 [Mycena floridula]
MSRKTANVAFSSSYSAIKPKITKTDVEDAEERVTSVTKKHWSSRRASSSKAVLCWLRRPTCSSAMNETDSDTIVTQIIQLSGMPGNYAYYWPLANKRVAKDWTSNTILALGLFTREQRDRILALADQIVFERTSVANSCRTWTRDLLEVTVKEDLLSESTFDEIDSKVPLLKRKPEEQ